MGSQKFYWRDISGIEILWKEWDQLVLKDKLGDSFNIGGRMNRAQD